MSNRHIIGYILLHTFTLLYYYSYTRRRNNEHAASNNRASLKKKFNNSSRVKQEMKYYFVEYKFNKQAVRIACFIDEVFSATVSVVY